MRGYKNSDIDLHLLEVYVRQAAIAGVADAIAAGEVDALRGALAILGLVKTSINNLHALGVEP